jgi:hypothetical protein
VESHLHCVVSGRARSDRDRAALPVRGRGVGEPHRFELRLEDSKGNELPLGDAPPGTRSPGKITRIGGEFGAGPVARGVEQIVPIAVNLNGMAFEGPSSFRFVISVDGVDLKELPFRVEQFAPQRPQVTGGGGYL